MDTINKTPAINPLSSLLIARTAPACLADAVNKPAPKMLMSEFWHEGELSVLFGNSGIGKSLLALQMGEAVSKGVAVKGFKTEVPAQKVLYFDFDTSDRRFAARYPDYKFNDNFIRVTINREHYELKKFGEQLFAAMEEAIKQHEAKVIIIDSLSTLKYLVNDLLFLTRLLQLKTQLKISVLLLAGTKKPQPGRPFTQGNLAANKMLTGWADNVFALGNSKLQENGRYLIQLKGKEMGRVYHQNNVVTGYDSSAVAVSGGGNSLPGFEFTGYGTEQAQLALPLSVDSLEAKILEYRSKAPHASLAEIAKWTGTNKMKVKRVLERYDGVKSETLNPKSENPQPSDPFRGDVKFPNHPSNSGVKNQSSPNPLLSRTISPQGGMPNAEPGHNNASPSDPFRGEVKLSNNTSHPGVKKETQPSPNPLPPRTISPQGGMPNAEPGHNNTILSPSLFSNPGLQSGGLANNPKLPSDPFRGDVELPGHTSHPGVKNENQSPELPENTAVTLVTPDDDLDDLVFEIRYDEPEPKKPSYSQQLRKRLHQASQQRKGGRKK